MNISRREFMQMLAIAAASGINLNSVQAGTTKQAGNNARSDIYQVPKFGNVSLIHYTDSHGQLDPVYFREPNINIGLGEMLGRPPHIVGENFLKHFNVKPGTAEAHAFTYLDYIAAAEKFGKVGGMAHLTSLVKKLKSERPGALVLDGGDSWQGSATSLWTNGQDMIDAQKILGIDATVGHWEFTYGEERVLEVVENDFEQANIAFLGQNVVDKDFEERVFAPYMMREMNGVPVAIIGQCFPYTPIANPGYMIPNWSFGIRDDELQSLG